MVDNPRENSSLNSSQILETPEIPSGFLSQKPRFLWQKWALIVSGILVVITISGYFVLSQMQTRAPLEAPGKKQKETGQAITAPVFASKFATYEEVPVNINPKIPPHSVDKNLANITNKDDFTFSESARNLLVKNAFIVVPADHQEFFSIYENNRYSQLPSFVTTDSMLHNYHMMFDYMLKKLEEEKLIPELKSLNAAMLSAVIEQYNAVRGTEWENAAKRNIGFFTVGSKLLDSGINLHEAVKSEVEQELNLIEAHQGIDPSPVMNIGAGKDMIIDTPQGPQPLEALKEDYSQYIPRGHYDKTESLKAYFKSMMWYGRLTFRFKNEDEIKSAILITLALNKNNNQNSWNKLYESINFFVGKSDDITYYQFKELIGQIYSQEISLAAITGNQNQFTSFVELTKDLEPPQINSMPIFQASIQQDREKEIKGFRFMGQRFTIDASIFQRLITREVGPKGAPCSNAPFDSGRMLPKGLDIPAAMGSDEALNILKDQGELQHACYPENMAKMKEYISGLDTDIWTQNLYWGWLYSLLPLTTEKGEGYPSFMQNLAWIKKELNTFLGSWTELKHDTILYAKQVYAELGGGPREEKDYRGYVEPNPYVYARLASLLKITKEGLEIRGLLSEKNKSNLEKMEQLALSLKKISEKELNNVGLSEEEYNLIKSYGGQLEHFWYEVFSEDYASPILDDDTDAPVVADVATDPNGQVLEEGTGYISEIYAVVPVDGKLRITKGGVYSYYEFTWPMSDRLTDKKWKELLKSGNAPQLPEWTKAFIAE